MNISHKVIQNIDERLKPSGNITYKGVINKDEIVVSTTEATIFLLKWTQKARGNTVIKVLLNGIASTAHTITFNLILDETNVITLKHGAITGNHNISFNKLYQGLRQGPHKLEVKASSDVGALTIGINNSRQVVIT